MQKWKRPQIRGNETKYFSFFTLIMLYVLAFTLASPAEIWEGMKRIVLSRDALVTDYFELAGYGASFFNAGLVMTMAIYLVIIEKIPFTGITLAALFINAGYGLWGKNPVNILPILLGVYLYAHNHKANMGRYIYTALFGICLAPVVTEVVYMLPFDWRISLPVAALTGVFIGYILPPLAMHTASMHLGYNLFNVGFAGGILAFIVVCIFRSLGMESEAVNIWKEGVPVWLCMGTFLYFILAFGLGFYGNGCSLKGLWRLTRHPGRAVADFVLTDGAGITLMNMGIMGSIGLVFILAVGGDLSGPVIGCLWILFGFAAFGAHPKNYIPVLLGVYLTTLLGIFSSDLPVMQMAFLCSVGLSPVAGQFGLGAGILAGTLHGFVVVHTARMYGGLNLYNNGFSAGWVAVVVVPLLESFIKHFHEKKKRG